MIENGENRLIYMDHAGTTPMHPEVLSAMKPYFIERFGNPSSIHYVGREARGALEDARGRVAALIGARHDEIVFTAGGTEADNAAIRGVALACENRGKHVITSAVEHHAVLDVCEFLARRGWKITVLPVDGDGLVDPGDVEKAVTKETTLVTIMHANNEIGTVQPIEEIGRIARERGVFFHTDAVQTAGVLTLNVAEMNIDLLSISAHKIYGPKGVGALYVRSGVKFSPLLFGGGQERKRRSGTENVPGIVGFGKTAELAAKERQQRVNHLLPLRERLKNGIFERIDDVTLNGHPEKRLPNNVNVCIKYVEGESMLLMLDMLGVAASSGSACTSGSLDPSHVLLAIGVPAEVAHGSLRFTLGRMNTLEHVEFVLEELPKIVDRLRKMSPVAPRR
ncbi:MAG: cysteine desulfurase NifS [bacterium]